MGRRGAAIGAFGGTRARLHDRAAGSRRNRRAAARAGSERLRLRHPTIPAASGARRECAGTDLRAGSAQLAEQLGILLRLVTENLRQLLNARLQAKRLARVSNETTIEALNNNPLKFSPSTEDALRIMFGPTTASYLNAQQAIEEGFGDLKEHQVRTYAAMQQRWRDRRRSRSAGDRERDEADRGLSG